MKTIKKTSMMLVVILIMQIVLPLFNATFENVFTSKTIAASSVYEISSAAEMWTFAKLINDGQTFSGKTVKLTKDIDLGCSKSNPWIPIAKEGRNITFTFDGNDHVISNMYISLEVDNGNNRGHGFFGYNYGGMIKNLTISNSTIEKTSASAEIDLRAGMICGINNGKILNCKTNNCKININKYKSRKYDMSEKFEIGGIVGVNYGFVEKCINGTQIFSSEYNTLSGGIVGDGEGIIFNSNNKSKITIEHGVAGGIAGNAYSGKIIYCNNYGEINVTKEAIGGGILGRSQGNMIIYGCGNNAKLSGTGEKSQLLLGGIIAKSDILNYNEYREVCIYNSYNIGNIESNYTSTNGTILSNDDKTGKIIVKNVYAVGSISQNGYCGLIAGIMYHAKFSLSNIYTSSSSNLFGNDIDTSTGVVSKSTTEMKKEDFIELLNKGSSEFSYDGQTLNNKGYPYINRTMGWKKINGIWYYFNKEELIQTGRLDVGGHTYYFNLKTAEMTKGWKSISGKWYYFCKSKNEIGENPEGAMLKGWNKIEYNGTNYWFYFVEDGSKYEGYKEGQMLLGRQLVKYNGKNYYYYFCEKTGEPEGYVKGAMIKSMTYKGFTYESSGACPDNVKPELSVSYSVTQATNENVIATITANEEIQGISGSEWTLSSNERMLTKTYTVNKSETVTVKDLKGNTQKITVSVTNIDKTKPTLKLTRNPESLTNGNVTATITSNEKVKIVSGNGWSISSDGKKLTKEYGDNASETVTVKDLAGNKESIAVKITNIDDVALKLNVSYNIEQATKENVIATITSNKDIKSISGSGWTIDKNNKKKATKTYTANGSETVTVKDGVGNSKSIKVTINNIDKTKPTLGIIKDKKEKTSEKVLVTIMANEEIQKVDGWTLKSDKKSIEKEYDRNTKETISVKDLIGNEETIIVEITNIDKEGPVLTVKYSTKNQINGSVIVTIIADEEIQGVDGWTLKSDKKSIEKTYEENEVEEIEVFDVIGNSSFKTITVENITKEGPTIKSEVYDIKSFFIKKISKNKTIREVVENLSIEATTVKYKNKENQEISTTETSKTGTKIVLDDKMEYILVVTGDADGNGNIDIMDLITINKHRLRKRELKDEYFEAGDVNQDGKIDVFDLININKARLGKIEL